MWNYHAACCSQVMAAYVWGVIALASISLAAQCRCVAMVSMLLLIYPVWETIFPFTARRCVVSLPAWLMLCTSISSSIAALSEAFSR